MLNRPLGLPVGNFQVLLRVEPKGRSPFWMLEHLIPHLRLIGLPQRTMMGTDENLRGDGLRLWDIGFLCGWLGGRLLRFLLCCIKNVGDKEKAEAKNASDRFHGLVPFEYQAR
jgi:hypothetical protein